MPSSLVFTALVVAWLAVLVPVAARRRQLVPRPAEADLCSRVLPRPQAAPAKEEIVVSQALRTRAGGARSGGGAAVMDREERPRYEADDYDLGEYEVDEHDAYLDEHEAEYRDVEYRDVEYRDVDGRGEELDEREIEALRDEDGRVYEDELAYEDDLDREPAPRRPYRPGRGDFDPEAAREANEARYAFRRRVALGLIVAAVLTGLGALIISSVLWWVHLLVDVALVGYLVYLRQQTRIEEEVRERRIARMNGERRALRTRHEREAEHEARMAEIDEYEWDERVEADDDLDEVEDDVHDAPARPLAAVRDEDHQPAATAPRWLAPRSAAPPVPDGLELVADTDDDPAFHDLESDRVPAYRRAAGA